MKADKNNLVPFEALPLVDVSPLWKGHRAERQRVIGELRRAATEVGFLYVTGHGIDLRYFRELEDAAAAFFELPTEVKLRYHINRSPNHRGYVPPGEELFYGGTKDVKEGFDTSREVDDPPDGPLQKFLGKNQWPAELPELEPCVLGYYHQAFELGRALLGAFAESVELPAGHFDRQLTCPPSQLRLLHYPPTRPGAGVMGIGAHTDYECLTLLHTTAPGLEVMNAAGNWVQAPPIDGALVVNIGDLLEIWTGGLFSSTWHRVQPVPQERYSFPLFFNLDYDTVIEPLPGMQRMDKRYQTVVAGDHLLAQTMQSFRYLIERRERGILALPDRALGLASLGTRPFTS